jgi:cobalt-zinc-cadmium efflux system outer membrane protein
VLDFDASAIVGIIRSHSPELKAARWRIDEARGRLRQSGLRTNPSLIAGYQHDAGFNELGGTIGFMQAFPVTARLRLEREVSEAEVEVAEAEVADFERRLAGRAMLIMVRYLSLIEQKDLRSRQIQLASELGAFTESMAQKGEGSPLDAAQARIEAGQLEIQLHRIEAQADQLLGELCTMVGLSRDRKISITGKLEPPAGIIENKEFDLRLRPDYRAAARAVIAAGTAVRLEEARRWNDITASFLGGVSRREDAPLGLVPEQRISVQVSIPLPLWNRNEGAVEERQATRSRLESSLAALEISIRNEALTALQMMQDEAGLLNEITREVLPMSRKQVDDTMQAYTNGLTDLLSVLRARDQHLRLQEDHLDCLRDYHLARIRFLTASGRLQ